MAHGTRSEVRLAASVTALGMAAGALFAHGLASLLEGRSARGLVEISSAVLFRWAATAWTGRELRRIRDETTHDLERQMLGLAQSSRQIEFTEIESAADAVRKGVGTTFASISARVALVAIAVVAYLGGWLAATIYLGLLGLSIPFYIRAGRAAEASQIEVGQSTSDLIRIQRASLDATLDVKSLGAVPFVVERIEAASRASTETVLHSIKVAMGSSLITDFIGGAAIGLVAMVVGFDLMNGRRSLGAGLVALTLVVEISLRVRQWSSTFHQREDAALGRQRLSMIELTSARRSGSDVMAELRDVTLPGVAEPVNLVVRSGERVVVTGPSGAGKTTLLRVLAGLTPPATGDATVTDAPIGWVHAGSQLLPTTLLENLRLDTTVSESEIRTILSNLNLTGDRFSDLHAPVESADQFSDGERARLALARAIVARVSLVIIDDVAGLFDADTLSCISHELTRHPTMALVEAGHGRRILNDCDTVVTLEPS